MAGDEVITPACWAAQRSSASDRFQVCPPKKQGGNQQMLEVRPKKGVEEVGKNGGVVYRKRWGRSQKRASSMNRNPTKQ